jgi:hypothetical protein
MLCMEYWEMSGEGTVVVAGPERDTGSKQL